MNKVCSICGRSDVEFPKTGKQCRVCKAEKLKNRKFTDPEYYIKRKKYRDKNKKKINDQKKLSYNRNNCTIKQKNNDYYYNNADKCRKRQREYQATKETIDITSWLTKCLKHSKKSDKTYNREFDLSLQFLIELFNKQCGRCAITNVTMTHLRNDLHAASIDRIDSKFGHTKNNVQLVCSGINRAKREYSNDQTFEFVKNIVDAHQNIIIPKFDGFKFPESTKFYSEPKKRLVRKQLDEMLVSFDPPTYNNDILNADLDAIDELSVADYLVGGKWRSHKPSNHTFAGKRLIYNFHQHVWDVRTLRKPLMRETWAIDCSIKHRAINNLVNGSTKISLDRIIREFVFAGVGIPSQMHPGFAKAVLLWFGNPGMRLFDPFAGWGSRLLAARSAGFKYHCCEMSDPTADGLKQMTDFAKFNCIIDNSDFFGSDIPTADIMFTSPPFGTEDYINAHQAVNINTVIDRTSHIKIRILHVNKHMLDRIEHKKVIPIKAKIRAASEKSEEFLAIL